MNERLLLFLLCGVLAGCDVVSNAQWVKTIPGAYVGSRSGFVEVVDLRPDGSFRHEITIDGKPLVSESGKWSYDAEENAVFVEPITSNWDQKNHNLTTNRVQRTRDVLFVMRHGTVADKISPSGENGLPVTEEQRSVTSDHAGCASAGIVS